jgi:hypothetical protein
MRLNDNLRNIIIVLALAALVMVLPGGGTAARVALQVVSLAFLAVIAWIAARMYREHRTTLYSLGDRRRAILYIAVGVATLTFTASPRLLGGGGPGTLVWLLLIIGAAYAVFAVFRAARRY